MRPVNRTRRLVRGLLAALGVTFLLATLMVDRFGQRQTWTRPAPAIVVLGARVLPGGVPSRALRARVERAVELFRGGAAPLLVFSGGVGDNPPSEARVMREWAISLGVPESACVLEEESHSTAENARFTAKLLEARGIQRAILVTDPYHLFRARQNFWRAGIDVEPVPALMSHRNLTLAERVRWTMREVIAVAWRPWLLVQRRPK